MGHYSAAGAEGIGFDSCPATRAKPAKSPMIYAEPGIISRNPTGANLKSSNFSKPAGFTGTLCLDPRFVPAKILGLGQAEAGVIRNVGGYVGPALECLLVVDHLLGIERVLVIHYTDCGALTFTNEEVRNALRARVPNVENVAHMEFGAITDLEQSVRDDLAALKQLQLMRKEVVDNSYGFVSDTKTGLPTAIEA